MERVGFNYDGITVRLAVHSVNGQTRLYWETNQETFHVLGDKTTTENAAIRQEGRCSLRFRC